MMPLIPFDHAFHFYCFLFGQVITWHPRASPVQLEYLWVYFELCYLISLKALATFEDCRTKTK